MSNPKRKPAAKPRKVMPEFIAKEVALKRRMMASCKATDQSFCIDCIRGAAFVKAAIAHYRPARVGKGKTK